MFITQCLNILQYYYIGSHTSCTSLEFSGLWYLAIKAFSNQLIMTSEFKQYI